MLIYVHFNLTGISLENRNMRLICVSMQYVICLFVCLYVLFVCLFVLLVCFFVCFFFFFVCFLFFVVFFFFLLFFFFFFLFVFYLFKYNRSCLWFHNNNKIIEFSHASHSLHFAIAKHHPMSDLTFVLSLFTKQINK